MTVSRRGLHSFLKKNIQTFDMEREGEGVLLASHKIARMIRRKRSIPREFFLRETSEIISEKNISEYVFRDFEEENIIYSIDKVEKP